MEIFMRFVLLLLGYSTVTLFVSAQNQSGFISLDCGLPGNSQNYSEVTTGIIYTSDADYIDTGSAYSVPDEFIRDRQQQMWHVRSFPQGRRNCYRLNLTSGVKYLIRGSFLYGNYDGLNKLPQFDLYLGPNLWETVKILNASTATFPEIIHVVASNYLHICLVNTDSGTPFISALELRPLKSTAYVAQTGSLEHFVRLDLGSTSGRTIRYKEDVYDRDWTAHNFIMWSNLSTALTIDANGSNYYQPAPIVMETAAKPTIESMPLNFYLETDDPNSQFYVYMHFAEIEELKTNESRQFNISLNGDLWYGPFSPEYLKTTTVFSKEALTGGTYNFSIIKTGDSTHPPIINAIEVYTVKKLLQSQTNQQDVNAITNIKLVYELKKDWEGDPCAPQAFLWEGLNCSYGTDDPPRIISLNLSSSGLTGEIPPYISNLTMIQRLDLSNNSLTGSVPEFLSKLQFLKTLKLSGNNLTGSVPVELIERSESGSLTLSVDGNPYLCTSVSCVKKKKHNVVVPVVAVFGSLVVLLAALAIFWRKRGGMWGGTPRKSSYLSTEKIRRYTYAELSMITDNFRRELGEGSFGKVYHGYLDDNTEVAVKILSELSNQGYEQFEAEVKLLQTVHHRNLTPLYGYCVEGKQIGLVYEYMANGNLKQHLSEKSADVISWEGRIRVAVEAAQGLEYLHHGCKPPRVHRDIKPENILLSENFHAKIADFGLTKSFPVESVTHLSTVVAGTFGYLDPQYCQTYRLTEKSDVFSFGVVLLELITSRPVIANTVENNHISQWVGSMIGQGDIKSIVDPRLRGDFDISSAWKAVEIAMLSVTQTSNERPTMNDVVRELTQCLEMEIGRKGTRGVEPRNQHEMVSLNLGIALNPSAR